MNLSDRLAEFRTVTLAPFASYVEARLYPHNRIPVADVPRWLDKARAVFNCTPGSREPLLLEANRAGLLFTFLIDPRVAAVFEEAATEAKRIRKHEPTASAQD